MEFFRQHLLSLVTFTPLVGALVLLLPPFAGRSRENAVRWVANGFGLARLPGQPAAVVLVRPRRERLPVRRARGVDPLDRRPVPARRRRHLDALDPAHDAARVRSRSCRPGRRHERVRAVLRVPAAAPDRHAGRLLRARHVPVLRVLGGHAGADVLPDRDLGRHAAAVRRDQVLPLHAGRLGGDAARASWRSTSTPRRCPAYAANGSFDYTRVARHGRSRPTCSSGCSWPSSSASRSRCRCSRSTPGCPTRTSRRPPRAR